MPIEFIRRVHELAEILQAGLRFSRLFGCKLFRLACPLQDRTCDVGHP